MKSLIFITILILGFFIKTWAQLPTPLNFNRISQDNTDEVESIIETLNDDGVVTITSESKEVSITKRWLPARTSDQAQLYYKGKVESNSADFGQVNGIFYNPKGEAASISTEIYADYFGPFRLSLGTIISTAFSSEDQDADELAQNSTDDAVQRIVSGGGNFVIGGSIPLLRLINSKEKENVSGINIEFRPKLALDVPKIGTDEGEYAFNWDVGLDLQMYYTGANRIFALLGYARFGLMGGNNDFYSNLNTDKGVFMFNQLSAFLVVKSIIRIGYSYYYGSTLAKDQSPKAFSFTIVPGK